MSRRILIALISAFAVAALVVPATAQRKQAGADAPKETPQSEMKKGGKPRIYVAASAGTNEAWTNDITRQALEEALVNSGRFEVIAGTQRDNLLKEQGFSNSDLVDPAQNAKVGRMLAARYVVSGTCQSITTTTKSTGGFGRLAGIGDQNLGSKVSAQIQIQMTDLESGTILLARSYNEKSSQDSGFGTSKTDNPQEAGYRGIITTVAQRFVGELGGTVPIEALIVLVEGGRVALSAGSSAGVSAGMRFEVYSEGEPIRNPATGEILSRRTTKWAVLRVTDVEEKLAWAEIVKTIGDGGVEDAAPNPSRIEAEMSARSIPGAAATVDPAGKKKKDK